MSVCALVNSGCYAVRFLFCLVVVSTCGLIANVWLVFNFGGGV